MLWQATKEGRTCHKGPVSVACREGPWSPYSVESCRRSVEEGDKYDMFSFFGLPPSLHADCLFFLVKKSISVALEYKE